MIDNQNKHQSNNKNQDNYQNKDQNSNTKNKGKKSDKIIKIKIKATTVKQINNHQKTRQVSKFDGFFDDFLLKNTWQSKNYMIYYI